MLSAVPKLRNDRYQFMADFHTNLLTTTLLVASTIAWCNTAWSAGSVVSSQIPAAPTDGKASIYYCDALVGAILEGWSTRAAEQFPLMAKDRPRAGTIQSSAGHPTDRLVLIVESDRKTLRMSSRRDFEAGGKGSAAPSPYELLQLDENFLVAFATGAAGPSSSSLITIDRKQGLGTWSTTLARDIISGVPRVETMALSCGGRQQ